ncbi:MAG: hypothetical protein IJB76_04405 [Clostridia bacterium]|nr:hypothetical protein [Clostridia bacterium]
MKKAMKVLGILLCAVLLVVGSVAATLAYLTAKSGTVTNTFTVGNVALELDEADTDKYGQPLINSSTTYEEGGQIKNVTIDNADRTDSNTYHLIASKKYVKDPTVTVTSLAGDLAYVRMILKVKGTTWTNLSQVLEGYDSDKWDLVNPSATAGTDGYIAYEFRYFETVGSKELEPLFTGIDVSTNEKYNLVSTLTNIDVEAHAIQADGFADATAAWAAFVAQGSTTPSE